ncbi:PREDICTED: vegetative cell wall protein gp1-like, partial [Cariama cristata]|uniref:vegetative cell wall protein gp1-like n=1 Tax=Cariama cristata TaxID=54380 RepID=UPI0005204AAF
MAGLTPLPSSPACRRAEFNPASPGPPTPSPLLTRGWLRRSQQQARWLCQRLSLADPPPLPPLPPLPPPPPPPPPPLAQPPIPAPSSCLHPCPAPRAVE